MNATLQNQVIFRQPFASRPGVRRRSAWHRLGKTLRLWRQRIRAREELLQLNYRDMRDIGVTAADVAFEVRQPFWREARRR